ncbi:type II TA system antitoxin MqsA family protein [Anaerobranca californiensis]|uniref:type II TA system antitoxin MqsA family protein n=1 Tax=Anaerobranca californiensis TaxID=182411 RepID=UPI001356614D|nr:type II TA system antitoxin MqsA family protein [Anaerobranca californiensis]
MKEEILKEINYDCPFCNKEHNIQVKKKISKAKIKDKLVEYEQIVYYCVEEDEDFVPSKIMDENLLKARDAYRASMGLLTSEEIKNIREIYGLTQKEFSHLLGWGDVTIGRYEKKLIQDETYDSVMRMIQTNPAYTLEMLKKHKEKFDSNRFEQIKENIKKVIKSQGNTIFKIQEIKNAYIEYDVESDFNGYKLIDIDKINAVIGYFAQYIKPLYKVKLMKLLWYTDALYFKRKGRSMTGLVYKHLPMGAVPIAYNELLYLPAVKVVEEFFDDFIAYKIYPNEEVNLSMFTLEEISVLDEIASYFKNFNTKEIVNYMHNEVAYLKTEIDQIIPYSLAKQLKNLE